MLELGNRSSIYQPEQADRKFPQELKTNDPKILRLHRKKRLVVACRAFAQWNFDYGFAGHLTIRDPEHPELYWTNPMAVHFGQVKLSNLIFDHDGTVEGDYAVNRAGFVLHAAVHTEHPDILAMCHAHTIYGVAYASLGRRLPPISQDACAFFEFMPSFLKKPVRSQSRPTQASKWLNHSQGLLLHSTKIMVC